MKQYSFLFLVSLALWVPCFQAVHVTVLRDDVFTLTGSDATVGCRPADGTEMAREMTSRSLVDCCQSCLKTENCEMAAFSQEQEVCLLYNQQLSPGPCNSPGDWKMAIKGEANNTTTQCLNGGNVAADGSSCRCYNGYVGNRCQRVMEDCYEAKQSGHYPNLGSSDQKVLWAQPRLMEQPVQVMCLSSGVVNFQRRQSPDVDFNRTWQEYVDGFGQAGLTFWLGLQNLYLFTNSKQYDLQVYFFTENQTRFYEIYNDFSVTENATYTASLGPLLQGGLGDHLHNMSGRPFSTYDNDNAVGSNCGERFGGGWWFDSCAEYNFNGQLVKTGVWSGLEKDVHYKGLGNVAPTAMSLGLKIPGT